MADKLKPTRWQQRFENFERAFALLQSVFTEKTTESLSALEREGVIQRFEYTFELAWKTLKDYLIYSGIQLEQVTPRAVIKAAFAANLITDGQGWIDMLEQRNQLYYAYDINNVMASIMPISQHHMHLLKALYIFLNDKIKASVKQSITEV